MKIESFPEKRILPEGEGEKMSKRKKEQMLHLMNGYFDKIDPENRPTILDFQGLVEGSGENEFLDWIKKTTDIEPELILADNSTIESQLVYKKLDYAYQSGKDFLKRTLKYSDGEISPGPDCPESISSKKNLFNFLSKTVLSRGGNGKGLSRAPVFCRLAKATIVAYETLKHSAESLSKITDTFENELIADSIFTKKNMSPLVSIHKSEKAKRFYVAEHGGLKGSLETRGKDLHKVMLRYINRAESNAEMALKDGIGIRITIEKKQVSELVPIISKWLFEKMHVKFLHFENKSFFSEKESKNFVEKVEEVLDKDNFSYQTGKSYHTTMGEYEGLIIKGIFHRESEKFTSFSLQARQFEIQILDVSHRNEKGKMNHDVFDVVKFIAARTRLDGGCREEIFNKFVEDASKISGLGEDKIRYYLLEADKAPIVKVRRTGNGKNNSYYAAYSVYKRWNGFGWVDGALMDDINFSYSSTKSKKRQ